MKSIIPYFFENYERCCKNLSSAAVVTGTLMVRLIKCGCPCSRQCASIDASADVAPCFQIGILTLNPIS